MDPSKTNATSLNQRQTVPDAADVDDMHDSPPPYEPSSAVSTSASANGASHGAAAAAASSAAFTPPASTFQPNPASPDHWEDDARSSTSSRGNEETGFLAGQRGRNEGGYRRPDPMVVGREDDKWENTLDQAGCCFSDTGGCCFSSTGGCCFSDRGGCCCSSRGGCCFSDTEGCCFSSNSACCCSGGARPQRR